MCGIPEYEGGLEGGSGLEFGPMMVVRRERKKEEGRKVR